jgi:hypothetical protein
MYLWIVALGLNWSCNSENAADCFQETGDLVREPLSVPEFSKITVFENIQLIVKQGDTHSVEVVTGEFLRNEVSAEVKDGTLLLRDTNDCNYVREYGTTIFYVTAPDITEIRSSTGFPIQSDGMLTYENLRLISESFLNPETETTDGAFNLTLNSQNVSIIVNGIAFFELRGNTINLDLIIAAGDSRIEAENLVAENITINHRGSNDMRIHPQSSLVGIIRGTGDVISFNRPDTVDVQILYKGDLIFRD